jgi:methionyl-tRNA formyltransferase
MRVVFFGSGHFALPTLRWLIESPHDPVMVVTQPARASGRGRRTTRTPVQALAEDSGLPVIACEDVNDPTFVEQIARLEARLGLVIAFGQKIGEASRSALSAGCVNLHASLLPKYRGAAPINWAIVRGEEKSGVTVFKLVDRMDAGPILLCRWTYIKPEETAGELHDRLAGIGVDAVQATFELFESGDPPPGEPQDDALATPARKLTKNDGFIDFDQPAERVAGHINGMTPWPGASARFAADDGRFESVAITRARKAESGEAEDLEPGEIDERRYVATASGFLEILEIKPSSGRLMTWAEYVNGRHVVPGDMFVSPTRQEADESA